MRRVLTSAYGVSDFKRVKSHDDRFSFVYLGRRCVVHEPFGDNSRYWIGPVEKEPPIDMASVHDAFSRCRLIPTGGNFGIVVIAWATVLVLCALGVLNYLLLLKWYESRPVQGGAAPVSPALSFSLDYVFAVWLTLPELGCAASAFTAFVTWRSFFNSRKIPGDRVWRGFVALGAIVASIGALVLLALVLPPKLATATRSSMCRNTTFQTALSPNGRYQASVIEVDCGAMSSFNRQVMLTRIPLTWASRSILFFNGNPTLHLSWSGRMLTIQGEVPPERLARPPPDPMVWGGIMARYLGPK